MDSPQRRTLAVVLYNYITIYIFIVPNVFYSMYIPLFILCHILSNNAMFVLKQIVLLQHIASIYRAFFPPIYDSTPDSHGSLHR